MKQKLTLGRYIAITINSMAKIFYQDIFVIEGFQYLENQSDMIVFYRINGKHKPILQTLLTKLIKDRKILNCFSREDVGEMGMLYGRLMERRMKQESS